MQLYLNYGNQILAFVIFAVSMNLLSGYAGIFSVAQAGFGAVGGYTTAYLLLNADIPLAAAGAAGVALAGVLGAVIALPAVRLVAEWLMLLTLAVHMIVLTLIGTVPALGGTYGLQGITGLDFLGHELQTPGDIFPVVLGLTVLVVVVAQRLGESPYGRVLRGIREDERATRGLGKNVGAYKLGVFSTTAAMAGLAGALLVVQNSVASPNTFQFGLVTLIAAIVIVGGSGNLAGSVLGSIVVVALTPFLERVLQLDPHRAALLREIVFGALLVIVMFLRPRGLLPEGSSYLRRGAANAKARLGGARTALTGGPSVAAPEQSGNGAAHGFSRLVIACSNEADEGQDRPVLEVRGLSKRFGSIVAADDLQLELRQGTITALVGPNGAGKTTLFNLLTGSLAPDAGSALLNGRNIIGLPPERVAQLGMVRSFQEVRIFPRLSALQNIQLAVPEQPGEHLLPLFLKPVASQRAERAARAAATDWLRFVGLEHLACAPAGTLAFGEQKLVALARVLATEAPVLLLDEPASGIDVQWVERMLSLIDRLREAGRTICIVEHNLHVVSRLADHIYFMEVGRITAEGSFRELKSEQRLAAAYFGTG